jgi:hypothetical protein
MKMIQLPREMNHGHSVKKPVLLDGLFFVMQNVANHRDLYRSAEPGLSLAGRANPAPAAGSAINGSRERNNAARTRQIHWQTALDCAVAGSVHQQWFVSLSGARLSVCP